MSDPQPLQPWQGDPQADAPDASSGGYLWMAGVACGAIIGVGSQALLGHFAERPALAAADPQLLQWMGWARWGGWILAGACLGAWLWALAKRRS